MIHKYIKKLGLIKRQCQKNYKSRHVAMITTYPCKNIRAVNLTKVHEPIKPLQTKTKYYQLIKHQSVYSFLHKDYAG
jgi:hypothetical protein